MDRQQCGDLPGRDGWQRAVIGEGSVVTKDIPPMCFAAGVPCRVIREITEEDLKEFEPVPLEPD